MKAQLTANAVQMGGEHYQGMQIQPWDFTEANNIDGIVSAAIWYLARYHLKNGVPDLTKAIHHIAKRIDIITDSVTLPRTVADELQKLSDLFGTMSQKVRSKVDKLESD